MRVVILVLIGVFIYSEIYCQCPQNLDFEQGNFTNWDCFIGKVLTAQKKNIINLSSSAPVNGRHTIMSSKTDKDSYGGFPTLCPFGGKYSVKLGNESVGAEAEGISYTFTLPTNVDTFTFTYFYAIVLEDPKHEEFGQPRFYVTAYEVATGKVIDCAAYNYVANGALPGFQQSPRSSDVWYKDWTPVSLRFAGLNGKQVRLEFKNADCAYTGHFGYSYLDVGSGCSNIIATAPYCIETNSLTLNGPYGFKDYVWYEDSALTKVVGNTQNITISPAPATFGNYFVDVIPFPGYGCKTVYQAVVKPLSIPSSASIPSDYYFCKNQSNATLRIVPDSGNVILWYGNDTLQPSSETPPIINTSKIGTIEMYISQKQLFGCEGYKKKIVVHIIDFSNSAISVNQANQCLSTNNYSFNSVASISNNIQYTWDFGDKDTLVTNRDTTVFHRYTKPGTYYVNLLANYFNQCTSRKNFTISVIPSPVSTFSSTNPICEQQTLVSFEDQSTVVDGSKITGWWWNVNGNISTTNKTNYLPTSDNPITVKFVIKTSDGCPADTATKTLIVQQKPISNFSFKEKILCSDEGLQLNDTSYFKKVANNDQITKWKWLVNNSNSYNIKNINNLVLNSGFTRIQLQVESNYGCISNTLDSSILVFQKPFIELKISDSCINKRVNYFVSDTNKVIVNNWIWNFGNGYYKSTNSFTTFYPKVQNVPFSIIGTSTNGCPDTIVRTLRIYDNVAFAGRDTIVAFNEPMQLDANGYPNQKYSWKPNIGLSNDTIVNPISLYDKEITYYLHSVTKEGCIKDSKINIKRYAGPALHIATAFSPNGDNLNDIIHVFPVGIKKFIHFSIYNKYGNLLFYTTNSLIGWDGYYKGILQPNDTYIAISEAVDYKGNALKYKGTITLVK